LKRLRFPAVVLAAILEPNLLQAHKKNISHTDGGKIVDAPSLGIAYLDLFLAQRDAIHNMCASELIWLWIDLVFRLQNSMVLRAVIVGGCDGQFFWSLPTRDGHCIGAPIKQKNIPRPTPLLTGKQLVVDSRW
jgi:hypothetical protein